MFPSPEEISKLREYLKRALQFAHDTEFELRFSTFTRNDLYQQGRPANPGQKSQNYRFLPIIDQSIFYKTLATFRTYGLLEHREQVTDAFYADYVRQTIDITGQSTWVTKTRSCYTDFHDYNVRASWATEVPHPGLDSSCYADRIRIKDRVSFTDRCARYDFTIVQSQNVRSGKDARTRTSYEIEIEFLPPPPSNNPRGNIKHLDYVVKHMIFCMRHMLQTLQGSTEIISLSKRHNVLLEYNTLTRVRHFLGAQPETFHRHHLHRIRSGYSISDKYDGERSLYFVSDDGHSYLIDRTMQVRLAQQACSTKEKGTILDVEVCGADVFAFDIVFHRGQDLRDRPDMDLLARLDVLSSAIATLHDENRALPGQQHHQQHLHMKKHYLTSDFAIVFDRWKQGGYEDSIPRDGFIFTPLAEPYPSKTKWGNLLKWKPAEMNSIDFLLADPVHTPTGTTYSLMVGDKEIRNVVFEPCREIHIQRDDPIWGSLREGMVLECTYDNNNGVLPWRPREDKQKPNYRHVALDVWKSMHEPVHLEDLEQSPLQNLRDYHNRVKEHVVQKATAAFLTHAAEQQEEERRWADDDDGEEELHHSIRVLDLACGRGGDLHKWRKAQGPGAYWDRIDYFGVDISAELLSEAAMRAGDVTRKHPHFTTQFAQGDLRSKQQATSVKEKMGVVNHSFDIASCQFALHYFYESEEAFSSFIGLVTDTLVDGGIFIASLFDGYRVYDICCKGDNEQLVNGVGFTITPQFDVRMGIANIKGKEFGIPVAVSISGDDDVILKHSTIEFLVFPDQFLLRMRMCGFHLQETQLFLDVGSELTSGPALSEIESAYSDLHRYYVFQYKKPASPSSATTWNSYPVASLVTGTIFKDGSEPPRVPELFTRSLGTNLDWLATYLELITGRPSLGDNLGAKCENQEELMKRLSEHFNVFLSIIEDNDGEITTISTYRPSIYLEDVKHIYVLRKLPRESAGIQLTIPAAHYYLVARECTDTKQRFLWFPSFGTELPEEAQASPILVQVSSPIPLEAPNALISFQGKFTIRDLHDLANRKNIVIPSNIRKKAEIVAFIEKFEDLSFS